MVLNYLHYMLLLFKTIDGLLMEFFPSQLKLYERRSNKLSGIEQIYAVINKVAKEQEAIVQPTTSPQEFVSSLGRPLHTHTHTFAC